MSAEFCFPAIAKPANATSLTGNKTVTIGVLTDETSQLSAIGLQIKYATIQAASDINAWLKTNDTTWAGSVNFQVDVSNYALSTTTALSDLSAFQTSGIGVVVGPLDSGTLGNIYSTAASDGIVLISPSSTSVALSGISPYVFREVPNDAAQGLADARMMYQDGVRQLIQVYIDTTYGSGLANSTAARFTALGGNVVAAVPYSSTTFDFTSTLATLSSEWSTAVTAAGGNASEVAIQAIGYEEVGDMLLQAKASYPSLLNGTQPWYGTDGESDDPAFTNSTFASVMEQVRMPATFYAVGNTSASTKVCDETGAMSGTGCSAYSQVAYDNTWLAALSILHCGVASGACISSVLPAIANESVGVTGPLTLGSDHDRIPSAYDIWAVFNVSGVATWELAGTWTTSADTVVWIKEPTF